MAGKNDLLNSTIGEGSVFEGKFYISGSLKIDGKFEGDIKTDEVLEVGVSGKVKTNINARSVIIAGTVIGNITAREEVKLLETAKVLGDIVTPTISIQHGVTLQGNVIINNSENKRDAKKIVEDSYSDSAQKTLLELKNKKLKK